MPDFLGLPNDPTPALSDVVALQAAAGGPGSTYYSTIAELLGFCVLVDGSQPLTANWDAGDFQIRAGQFLVTASGDAEFTAYNGVDTGSAVSLKSVDATRGELNKSCSSGPAQLDFNPKPADGTSSAQFRFFRDTSTTGTVSFTIFKGDGTSTINARFAGNVNSYICADNGNFAVGTAIGPGTGATYNLVLAGPTTSPVLGAAKADMVHMAAVDNGAGNRELQVQPESGGLFALGNNRFRRVPAATRDIEHRTATLNTTDDTVSTLATVAISADYTYQIEVAIVARRTGGASGTADDGASYRRIATYTTKSGTVTLLGSVQTLGTDAEDQVGWDATLDISTTNVRVRVTGAASNNITWFADVTVRRVSS